MCCVLSKRRSGLVQQSQDQGKIEGLAACYSQTANPFGSLNHFCFEILSNFICSGESTQAYWQQSLHAQMIAFCREITARSYRVAVIDFTKLQNMKWFLLFLSSFIRLLIKMIIKSPFYFALSHGRYYRLCGRAFLPHDLRLWRFKMKCQKLMFWFQNWKTSDTGCKTRWHKL